MWKFFEHRLRRAPIFCILLMGLFWAPIGNAAEPVTIKPVSGWQAYGAGYTEPGALKQGDVVTLMGMFRRKGGKWGHVGTLPTGYRPPARLIFNVNHHEASARVDVLPDGKIVWVAGGKKHDWLGIWGISFSTKKGKSLPLTKGWRTYGSGYAAPNYQTSGDMVVLSGLIKNTGGKWGHVASLPKSLAPKTSLIFNVNHHEGTARVDVFKDGRVYWSTGANKHKWISLDGIKFLRNPKTKLKTVGGWKGYGGGYQEPTATRIGDMVYLQSIVRNFSGGKWGHIATLPTNMRPATRLAFSANNHERASRVDVLADGRIGWQAGTLSSKAGGAKGWLSLSGIAFYLPKGKTTGAKTSKPAAKYTGSPASAAKKAVSDSGSAKTLTIGDIADLAKLPIVKSTGIGSLKIKGVKIEGNAIWGKVTFLGKSAEMMIFGAKGASGKLNWHFAVRPQNFSFKEIITDVGEYLDKVTPKSNTFLFTTATENYPKTKLPKKAQSFFANFFTNKGRLDNKRGALRLDAGFMYMGHLTPDSESETMKRIRELIGFRGDKVLMVGRLGLGFVASVFSGTKPSGSEAKEVFVELEATYPPYNPDYLPHYIGTTDVIMGIHGSKKKVVGYAIMNMPVCVDSTRLKESQPCKQTVNFAGVISAGKNAGFRSRDMINTWRLSPDLETETAKGRKKLADAKKNKRKSRKSDETKRAKKDKDNKKKDDKITGKNGAKQQHAQRQQAAANPGSERGRKNTKKQKKAGGGGKFFSSTDKIKGKPRFAIYAEAKGWKDFFGIKEIDLNEMRMKINVYKKRQFSVGYYGDAKLMGKHDVILGNNYFFQRVPQIQYIPIPAVYASLNTIKGQDIVDYCNLGMDVLKVKERCETFDVIKDSRFDNVTVKIVPPLAAEEDLGLTPGVDITGIYYHKDAEIAGAYGSADPNGFMIQAYKTAFRLGPVNIREVSYTLDWQRGKSYTMAYAGGYEVLGAMQDVYYRIGKRDLSGYVHINYFDQLEAELYLEKLYQKFPGYTSPKGYEYRAVLKADFKKRLAELVLKDPVLKKLLDDFAKAHKIIGPAFQWKPVKDFTAGFQATLQELRKFRKELIKLRKDFEALTVRQLEKLDAMLRELDRMIDQLNGMFDNMEIDPKKLKALAVKATELTAKEMGLPPAIHKKLRDLGRLYLKADPFEKAFKVSGPDGLKALTKPITWKEPQLQCGDFAKAATFPMKPPKCQMKMVERTFDYKPDKYDEAFAAMDAADKIAKQLAKDLPKLLKAAYKQAFAEARAWADKARLAAKKMRAEIERLKILAKDLASLLKYVDDIGTLQKYLKDYDKLIQVAHDIKDKLPTPPTIPKLAPPALRPFMTGQLSITGIDALIKKELKPLEKYFLDILTILEVTAKIVGDLSTVGTVAAVEGTKLGITTAHKEYADAVGDMLSTGGRLAAYYAYMRKAEQAVMTALAALDHYSRNNQYIDAFNDAMGGYKNEDSLFRIVKASVEGRLEGQNPTQGKMLIDVEIAGTGWSAGVEWDFNKGMKGIFNVLKIELQAYLEEETQS